MKWIIFILFCLFAWCFACVHGITEYMPPPPPPPPQELQVIDSCDVQDIDEPPQWCLRVTEVTRDISNIAIIKWRGTSKTWIMGFQVLDSTHIAHLIEIVDEHINFTDANWIDKSSVSASVIHLDFTLCFTNPLGSLIMGNEDHIYIEFDLPQTARELENDRIKVIKDNIGSIYPPNESTNEEITQLVKEGWQIVGLYESELDSLNLIPVWDHLLMGCKCCAKIDIRGLDISQEYIDQFIYQQITVTQ